MRGAQAPRFTRSLTSKVQTPKPLRRSGFGPCDTRCDPTDRPRISSSEGHAASGWSSERARDSVLENKGFNPADKMLVRWGFLIVSIFTWCIYVNGASSKQVNCQRYVFHPNCRGSQAKKRFTNLDYDNSEPACVCPNSKKINNNAIGTLSSSKLLEALFDKGFDANTIYEAYMATSDRRRDYNINRDRSSQRRKSLQENSIDLGNLDLDEDY